MDHAHHVQTLRDLGYLEPRDLAELLQLRSPQTLSNWRSSGIGPPSAKLHGNKIVYHIDAVKKWIADRQKAPSKAPTMVSGTRRTAPRPRKSKSNRSARG